MLSEALYYGESPKMMTMKGGGRSNNGGGNLMREAAGERSHNNNNMMQFNSNTTTSPPSTQHTHQQRHQHRHQEHQQPSALDMKLMELIAEREDQFRILSPPRAASGAARRQGISRSAAIQSHGGLNGSLVGVSTASLNPKLQVDDAGRSPWLLKSAVDYGGATMSNVSIASRSPGAQQQQHNIGTTFSRPRHQPLASSRRASTNNNNINDVSGNVSTFHRHDKYAANATISSPTKVSEYGYAGRALHALQHKKQHHVDVMGGDLQDYPDPYPQDDDNNNHYHHHDGDVRQGEDHPYHRGSGRGEAPSSSRRHAASALRSVSASSLVAHIDHQLEGDINEHRYDIDGGGRDHHNQQHHYPRSVSPRVNFGQPTVGGGGRVAAPSGGGGGSRSVSPQEARFVQQQRHQQQSSRSASLAVSPFSYYSSGRHHPSGGEVEGGHHNITKVATSATLTRQAVVLRGGNTTGNTSRTTTPTGRVGGQQQHTAPPTYFSTKSMSEEEKHVVLSTLQLVLNMTSPSASETYRRGNGLGRSVALPIRNGGSGDASSFISTAVPGRCSGGRGDYSGAGGWAAFHQRVQLLLTTSSAILQCVSGITNRPTTSFIGGSGASSTSRTGTPNHYNNRLRSASSRGGATRSSSTTTASRSHQHAMTERTLMIMLPRAAATAAAGNSGSDIVYINNNTSTTTATVAQVRGFLTLKRAHLEKVVSVLGQHFDDWDSLHPLSLEYYAVLCCADYLVNACAVWQPMGILISDDENGHRGGSSSLRVLNVSRRKIASLLHDVLLERTIFGL